MKRSAVYNIDGAMVSKWFILKCAQESSCRLIEVLFRYFACKTEENHYKSRHPSRRIDRDSNRAHPNIDAASASCLTVVLARRWFRILLSDTVQERGLVKQCSGCRVDDARS